MNIAEYIEKIDQLHLQLLKDANSKKKRALDDDAEEQSVAHSRSPGSPLHQAQQLIAMFSGPPYNFHNVNLTHALTMFFYEMPLKFEMYQAEMPAIVLKHQQEYADIIRKELANLAEELRLLSYPKEYFEKIKAHALQLEKNRAHKPNFPLPESAKAVIEFIQEVDEHYDFEALIKHRFFADRFKECHDEVSEMVDKLRSLCAKLSNGVYKLEADLALILDPQKTTPFWKLRKELETPIVITREYREMMWGNRGNV